MSFNRALLFFAFIFLTSCSSSNIIFHAEGKRWVNVEDIVSEKMMLEGVPSDVVLRSKRKYKKYLKLSDGVYITNVEDEEVRFNYSVFPNYKFKKIDILDEKTFFAIRLDGVLHENSSFDREKLDKSVRLFVKENIRGDYYWVEYLVMRQGNEYVRLFGTEAVWKEE